MNLKFIIGLIFVLVGNISYAKTTKQNESPHSYAARKPSDVGTNCEATGLDKVFPNEYKQAISAWCQDRSKATYMVEILLKALVDRKAYFSSGAGALVDLSGFTAIALGGYTLEGGMIHIEEKTGRMISLSFVSSDPNNDVKYYRATYKIDSSVFFGSLPKKN